MARPTDRLLAIDRRYLLLLLDAPSIRRFAGQKYHRLRAYDAPQRARRFDSAPCHALGARHISTTFDVRRFDKHGDVA